MSSQEYDFDTEGQVEQGQQMMTYQTYPTMMTPQPGMMAPVGSHRECRTPTKMVAICNMICNILYLTFLLVIICLGTYVLLELENIFRNVLEMEPYQEIPPALHEFIRLIRIALTVIIIILLIIAVFIGIELWIAIGLLQATYIGTPAVQAIQKAKCWLCCHICLVIMNLLFGGLVFISPASIAKSSTTTTTTTSEHSRSSSSSYSSHTTSSIERQVDGFTIGFGGFNLAILLMRLLFIFIVHGFMQQLRRVGFMQ